MRVRMIRPAYWTDADLHTRLTAEVREFYIGLWMLSDDAGYVSWDVDRVGAEMYPYVAHTERTANLRAWLDLLGEDHARLLDCGRHVLVPNLAKNQSPPRPAFPNRTAHERCIRQMVAPARSGDHMGAGATSTGREGKGRELKGGAAALVENDGETEFQRLVPRPLALGGKAS